MEEVVLACPSFWTAAQRNSLIEAASSCGLNVLSLVNETTAVALNYGMR